MTIPSQSCGRGKCKYPLEEQTKKLSLLTKEQQSETQQEKVTTQMMQATPMPFPALAHFLVVVVRCVKVNTFPRRWQRSAWEKFLFEKRILRTELFHTGVLRSAELPSFQLSCMVNCFSISPQISLKVPLRSGSWFSACPIMSE
ncbi:unnamed protein product [Heterosigma akashiwo]